MEKDDRGAPSSVAAGFPLHLLHRHPPAFLVLMITVPHDGRQSLLAPDTRGIPHGTDFQSMRRNHLRTGACRGLSRSRPRSQAKRSCFAGDRKREALDPGTASCSQIFFPARSCSTATSRRYLATRMTSPHRATRIQRRTARTSALTCTRTF